MEYRWNTLLFRIFTPNKLVTAYRTCLKWLMKFGAADIHMGEGVSLDEIKAKLPCLKKYYARGKIGVKEEKEGEQKTQALKPPAHQAPNASVSFYVQ
ncbi:hypothetical protein DdX_08100 [Ditylenchus destructor]|uniref:Uncharacterized protein n=1 Tax=Ditylenchus destructor TaxID=166010 RepID=A0AAD4N3V0_9BILA|nr:hypothetical protein DdX_08100 [Ditylenchus destructor]